MLTGEYYEVPADTYYVPRDENFSDQKILEFAQLSKTALGGSLGPLVLSMYLNTTSNEFNGIEEVLKMYEGGVNLPISITGNTPPSALNFPTPDVIKGSNYSSLRCIYITILSKPYTLCEFYFLCYDFV